MKDNTKQQKLVRIDFWQNLEAAQFYPDFEGDKERFFEDNSIHNYLIAHLSSLGIEVEFRPSDKHLKFINYRNWECDTNAEGKIDQDDEGNDIEIYYEDSSLYIDRSTIINLLLFTLPKGLFEEYGLEKNKNNVTCLLDLVDSMYVVGVSHKAPERSNYAKMMKEIRENRKDIVPKYIRGN